MVLYKYVRHLVRSVSENNHAPLIFVPIGDELEEATTTVSGIALEHAAMTLNISLSQPVSVEDQNRIEAYLKQHYSYTEEQLSSSCIHFAKKAADHNLIKFFERDPFKGKPMGAQINFLLQLSINFNVIHIGMRSGSMERLMYLGVPTIYFDRTEKVEGLDAPVGHQRIKQLCSFHGKTKSDLLQYFGTCQSYLQGKSEKMNGYPLFFQIENIDTGQLKYLSLTESRVKKQIERLTAKQNAYAYQIIQKKLLQKNFLQMTSLNSYERQALEFGSLQGREAEKLEFMIWFICEMSPYYNDLIGGLRVEPKFRINNYSQQFRNQLGKLRDDEFTKRRDRLIKTFRMITSSAPDGELSPERVLASGPWPAGPL